MKWASLVNVLLGIWLIAAPWTLGYVSATATNNDVLIGSGIVVLAIGSLMVRPSHIGPAWANLLLGLWLVCAPWILAYNPWVTSAVLNDVVVGVLVMASAAGRIMGAGRTLTV